MVEFVCKSCGTPTVLTDADQVPPSELCPPCAFFGPGWEDDPHLAEMVDSMQRKH